MALLFWTAVWALGSAVLTVGDRLYWAGKRGAMRCRDRARAMERNRR